MMIDLTLPEQFMRHVSNGDADQVHALLHPDFVSHGAAGQLIDREGMRGTVSMFKTAFPDLTVRAVDVLVQDNRIAWRVEGTGTHTGDFMGIPGTGRTVAFTGVDIAQIRDGSFLTHWSGEDLAGILIQIGAIPSHRRRDDSPPAV
jgi:predicted ester cyclase